MMKTVAILGASGFLGQSLCKFLHARKTRFLLSSKNGGCFEGFPITKVDLTRKNALSHWLGNRRVDALFYLSSVMPEDFTQNEFTALNQNIAIHEQVCQFWRKCRCHLIYASSAAVYGNASVPWREAGPVSPESYYALSKLLGEQMFFRVSQQEDIGVTTLRIKAPYGVKDHNKTVVNIFLEKALSGADLELFGHGRRRQDFVYIDDVAKAFWLAFLKKKSGVYNISGGVTVTMRQLAEAVICVTHSKSNIVFNGKADPQEGIKVKVDIEKARRELGFRPGHTLETGLKKMAKIYQGRQLSS